VNALSAILVAGVAFGLTAALTPVVRSVAWRVGYVTAPRSDRWHRRPTALFGGVAVLAGTAAAFFLLVPRWPAPILAVALGSVGAFIVGLLDDLFSFRPGTKLTMQVVIASAALAGGVRLDWTGSATIDSLLSVLWLIGLTNAFNLIDNMDGACTGVGAIAGATLAAVGFLSPSGAGPGTALAAALCGALLGFLIYNFHPASIFLGDSGSLFIGFLLAGLSVMPDGHKGPLPAAMVAVPILVLLVPIFDTTLVTISRKLSGRPASRGGTDHTAHRLVALGFSESNAVLFLYAMAIGSGGVAILLTQIGTGTEVLLALLVVGALLFGVALLRVRVYGGEDFSLLLGGRWRSTLAALLLRHHVFEVGLDVVLVTAAYYAAYWMRFDQAEFAFFFPTFLASLPVVLACKIVSLRLAGVYGGLWKYFGTSEIVAVLKGVGLGSVMAVLLLTYLYRFERMSRSVFVIDGLLLAALLVGSRMGVRLLPAAGDGARLVSHRAIAYGAGDAGEMLARELFNNPRYPYHLVAFVDDDPYKRGRSIRGVPVVGGLAEIDGLLDSGVEAVILTSNKLGAPAIQSVRAACEEADIPLLRFSCVLKEVGARRRQGLRTAAAATTTESAAAPPPAVRN
jgi:UDP-GlcNAc:undecaprenyl-phosphate/decaprenyl-phosphate GlcNAc-1-phosphate transferase